MKTVFINPGMQEMDGLNCLSAVLKQAGHETALIRDPRLFNNAWIKKPWLAAATDIQEWVLARVATQSPDLVALTVVSDDYSWASRWAKLIKERLGVPVVMGNIHPTANPLEVMAQPEVDFVVRGEGEFTLLELVEALANHQGYEKIQGLAFRRGGRTLINPMRPLIEDLDILPFPDKDLSYREMPYLNLGYATMSGRGCPYRCTFCDNNTSANIYKESGHKQRWTRRHSPEYMVRELVAAKERWGIRHIRFNDEDWSYDKKWIRAFCEIYKSEVGLPYFAWVYPNTIDAEIARAMADSGCEAVEMGIQSGSERLRADIIHRRTPNPAITGAMKALRDHGIRTTVDIIVGLPTETNEDLDSSALLLAEGNPWHLYAFFLRYYKNTEILTIAKERQLLAPEQIAYIEKDQHSRGHIAGGTELEKSPLARRYHTLFLLIPLLPQAWVRKIIAKGWVRYIPRLNPFFTVNITKIIKRDRFNELRARGWAALLYEVPRVIKEALKLRLREYTGGSDGPTREKVEAQSA